MTTAINWDEVGPKAIQKALRLKANRQQSYRQEQQRAYKDTEPLFAELLQKAKSDLQRRIEKNLPERIDHGIPSLSIEIGEIPANVGAYFRSKNDSDNALQTHGELDVPPKLQELFDYIRSLGLEVHTQYWKHDCASDHSRRSVFKINALVPKNVMEELIKAANTVS